jgi:hypothetical protein
MTCTKLVDGCYTKLRESKSALWVLISAGIVIALAIAAMHVFATRSHGSWPGALARLLLISATVVDRRLTPQAQPDAVG